MDDTKDTTGKREPGRTPAAPAKKVKADRITPGLDHPDVSCTPEANGNFTEADLTLHGMHCDSCGKIIGRTVLKSEGACIRECDRVNNRIVLACRSRHQIGEIRRTLLEKGYQALLAGEEAQQGFEAGSFHRGISFIKSVYTGENGFETENLLVIFAYGPKAGTVLGSF